MPIVSKLFRENKAEEAKKGSMVALFINPFQGKRLRNLFEDIEGDVVQPEDMHITIGLVNSGDGNLIMKTLEDVAQQFKPFALNLAGFDAFPPSEHNDQKFVIHAKPEEEQDLLSLHDLVLNALGKKGVSIDNGHFGFNPHVTIKYAEEAPPPETMRLSGRMRLPIDQISFARNGAVKHLKLG